MDELDLDASARRQFIAELFGHIRDTGKARELASQLASEEERKMIEKRLAPQDLPDRQETKVETPEEWLTRAGEMDLTPLQRPAGAFLVGSVG